jgi:hypothetical protein
MNEAEESLKQLERMLAEILELGRELTSQGQPLRIKRYTFQGIMGKQPLEATTVVLDLGVGPEAEHLAYMAHGQIANRHQREAKRLRAEIEAMKKLPKGDC